MKKRNILGLDLGTTSIGWAHVIEDEGALNSSIVNLGVRVNPLTTDEQTNFEKGKPISVNSDRTLKRGARRNLQRFKLRRENLIDVLKKTGFINDDTKLAEDGKNTTHQTWELRSKAVNEKIEKEEIAKVFLTINKKRGYKSSRKAKNHDEGQIIDGMSIAKRLYEEDLTPGQLAYQLIKEGKKTLPDFYRSDLQTEFIKVWTFQKKYHPEILTEEFYNEIQGKGQRATSAAFWNTFKFNTAENKGTRDEKKYNSYEWRNKAISEKLEKEELAYVLTEINNNLNNSSGYLGAISDRSKELFFNKQTVGQYLFSLLEKSQHNRLKNQVFYRQDYLDEFEAIWKEQSKHYIELTNELKIDIRDIIIFYQRKLKSQKNLISFCEFESFEKIVNEKKMIVGRKVAPRSSPLFQEFKIWQVLNNIEIKNKVTNEISQLDFESKQILFTELNLKGNLSSSRIIELLGYKPKDLEIKYSKIEGNQTNKALYEAYLNILEIEGYEIKELLNIKSTKDKVDLDEIEVGAVEIKKMIKSVFETLNINTNILDFDAELEGENFENQTAYQLWHLLYSYEDDDSPSGNEKLYELLENKFGFRIEHAKVLANVSFISDYGNLSTKAIRKIFPFIKESNYATACDLAGYNHSKNSLTKAQIESRPLNNNLELLKKNSLRNPVVEKILNQMINVVNKLIDINSKRDENGNITEYFKFDEVRIELARELKKNAKERALMTTNINAAKIKHEQIIKILQNEFSVINPSRNDIIRYKLYEELKNNDYKDLYTDKYIPKSILFSKQIDVDHIIPQARMFDDSFSNKTLTYRDANLKKGNKTAHDYILNELGENKLDEFIQRITKLFDAAKKNQEDGISKAKFQKLQKKESEIGDGFINRDIQDTKYISRKAKELIFQITKTVVSTSGSITDRLRDDWGLVNVMQELNMEKFRKIGHTEMVKKNDGTEKERIIDWSKRNDHRHHAMDALTVAFTKHNHIQYLNFLNARYNEDHKEFKNIKAIEDKETHWISDDNGNKKRIFNLPIKNFRQIAKEYLENILVSHKAKNKVFTKNKNEIKSAKGKNVKKELTPRGQLHKESVYSKIKLPNVYEEKVGLKFDSETIQLVANTKLKELLIKRLSENNNDPKLAFTGKNSLSKSPIYLNEEKTEVMPEKVKIIRLEDDFVIRKEIVGSNPTSKQFVPDEKSIEKVIDNGVKRILLDRLIQFKNNPKEAFSNLELNPIWLNKDKKIAIKSVTISAVKNAESLHFKKDHLGKELNDKNGNKIPVDFVSTGNNHHVAFYRDENGELQERLVSFFEAVQLVNAGLQVVDKEYNKGMGWQYLFSMKQNEYFVFPNEKIGFNPNEIDLKDPINYKKVSPNLFRVQTISIVKYGNSTIRDFKFRHHLETRLEDSKTLQGLTFQQIKSLKPLETIVKVRINHIGVIVHVGEE